MDKERERSRIDRPIFIIGSGRSGTSILYNLMALHPQVYWFSNVSNVFPKRRIPLLIHRLLDVPFVGPILKRRIIKHPRPRIALRPGEGGNIFHSVCGLQHDRKSTAEDHDPGAEACLRRAILAHQYKTGKSRFLNKQTANTQRIGLIDRMFPDALYIHIIRDGRGVANSLCNTDWWRDVDVWWLGVRAGDWRQGNLDPIVLCGENWRRNIEEIHSHREQLGGRYLEIRYEKLTAAVRETVDEILSFCDLTPTADFFNMLPPTLPDMNKKWHLDLSVSQQKQLEEAIGADLKRLGYD